jgi:hypothetical protein
VPHDLTEAQNIERMGLSRNLPESHRPHQDTEFKGLATGHEVGVDSRHQKASVYASSREEVSLMVRDAIGTPKGMILFSLGGEWLICVDTFDPNEAFTQDNFINFVCPDMKRPAQNLRRPEHSIELAMHMDH